MFPNHNPHQGQPPTTRGGFSSSRFGPQSGIGQQRPNMMGSSMMQQQGLNPGIVQGQGRMSQASMLQQAAPMPYQPGIDLRSQFAQRASIDGGMMQNRIQQDQYQQGSFMGMRGNVSGAGGGTLNNLPQRSAYIQGGAGEIGTQGNMGMEHSDESVCPFTGLRPGETREFNGSSIRHLTVAESAAARAANPELFARMDAERARYYAMRRG